MKRFLRSSATFALLFVLSGSAAPGAEPAAEKSSGLLAELQKELGRLGYRPGKADGIPKETTRRAIRNYQRVLRESATGEPSDALLVEMRKPCEVVFDDRGYKKPRGGCPRPSAIPNFPEVYLLDLGEGEEIIKLETLEED